MTLGETGKGEKRRRRAGRPGREEAGYTLMLVAFFAAAMLVAASAAVPNLILQSRRQREKLMIWRGQQYAGAIGLFYRRTGHFPQDLKQLEKPVNGIYVLRKAYKDPMNAEDDGAWRLIYMAPGGALLGSLRWHTLAEYQAYLKGIPLPGNGQGAGQGANPFAFSSTGGSTTPGQGSETPAPGPITSPLPNSKVIREGDMIGGNLIGVGSLVKADSIKVYVGASNYREWEFIWNPLQGQTTPVAPGTPPAGTPTQTSPFSILPIKPQVPQVPQDH